MSHVRECPQCGEIYVPVNGACPTCAAKGLTYIDCVIASEEFQGKARENEAYWEKHHRQYNPAFAEALALSAAIRLMHAGNKP